MDDVREQLQEIFRANFNDSSIIIRDEMTAADIDGWDSLGHINLIIAVEKKLKIRFAIVEISQLKEDGKNVGSFIKLIESKISPS